MCNGAAIRRGDSGWGPAGSAAARVAVLDKAEFPRDKPCGDGLPRPVSFVQKIGLADRVAKFHRLNRATIFSPTEWECSFPRRPGMPHDGHGIRRSELDTMLLRNAQLAGAEVRQGVEVVEVVAPIVDDAARVTGVALASALRVLVRWA